ncbi:bifunctional diguanylate cyclase/phosphodiesterase [Halomonas alkalicola]|uniref:bifunctional diguanylate cyclase/phosphodiesterase n=1 Tax=Halomonas alkalicola TaxID=1930622 RepID=UPI00265FF370|nr:EAL domain-containing protein [Halomonas alkalicola]
MAPQERDPTPPSPVSVIAQDYRRLRRGLALLLSLAVIFIVGILLLAAGEQNRQQARHTEQQIAVQLSQIHQRLAGVVMDYAVWDLSHLAIHRPEGPDLDWLEVEMGTNLHDNLGIDLALIVAPDGEVVWEVREGEILPPRRRSQRLPVIPPDQAAATTFLRLDDELLMMAAAPIQPESPHHPAASAPHQLLFAYRLGQGPLAQLRATSGLADLRLLDAPAAEGGGLALHGPGETPEAWLAWTPATPGTLMVRRSLPWLIMTLLGLGILGTGLFRHLGRQAEASLSTIAELRQTHARLADQQRAWHGLRDMQLEEVSEEAFIEALLARSAELLDVDDVNLWVMEGERLVCAASLRKPELVGQSLGGHRLQTYLAQLRHHPALVTDDAQNDPRLVDLAPYLRQQKITSLLDIGLFLAGELRGVLCCEDHRSRRWRDDEVNALMGLTGLLTQFAESLRRREVELSLDRQLNHDEVSGLPTLRGLDETISPLLEQGECQVGILHLKGLTQINDTLGTAMGDAAFHAVGRLLSRRLAAPALAGSAARLPANRILLLLPGADSSLRQQALEDLLEELDGREWLGAQQAASLRFALGLASCPRDGHDIHRLLQRAELALDTARDMPVHHLARYEPAMGEWQARVSRLERELREALTRREFRLHLQPQFDAAGRLHGAEALLRWEHPERGLLAPGAFIAEAEHSGLIRPIGKWVLDEALGLLAGPLRDSDMVVAVNVSVQQLRDDAFTQQLSEALASRAVPACRLVLEVVESMLVTPEIRRRLESLQALGVPIALDDFGTGYSSLRYLQQLRVHEIKLDRAFIEPLKHADDAPLARSIIAMAQALELQLVAEGVETEAQADFLRRHGVTLMQGYLLARPEPVEAFLARVKGSR